MQPKIPVPQLDSLYEDWLCFATDGRLEACSSFLIERWRDNGLLDEAKQAKDFFKLTPTDIEAFFVAWVSAIKGRASSLKLRLAGFEHVERNFLFSPQFSQDGSVSGILAGSLRPLVSAEDESGEANPEGLPEAVAKLAEMRDLFKDIAKANRDLEAALTEARTEIEFGRSECLAKTNFLATMSHEIRTPMNAVIGFCDLLSNTSLSKEQEEYVSAINHSGKLLIDLIGQILDYSKIESGHTQLECDEFELDAVLVEVQAILGTRMRGRKLDFSMKCGEVSGESLIGDSTRLKQILINLLSNAFKFTKEGGVSLTATTSSSCHPGHLALRVEIEDTGVGIAPDRLKSLFFPFAQAHENIVTEFGGTGLGLAICKRLCQAMNGDVWVKRTELGVGSVFAFEIHIPKKDSGLSGVSQNVCRPDELRVAVPRKNEALANQIPKLLVVDDNPNNLLITSKLSQHLGYAAETASSGVDALERMKDGSFDIVLMDVRMAPMNGIETTRMIRKGEAGVDNSSAYIIAVTAHALQGDREKCIESGMNDYLSKPLTLERLEASLNRARSELSLD